MKIKHLLTKTLLVAVGLLVGQSVWAESLIFTEDFADETYNVTWGGTSAGGISPAVGDGALKVANGSQSGDRSAYIAFGTNAYTGCCRLTFDVAMTKSGWSGKNNYLYVLPTATTERYPSTANAALAITQESNGAITIAGESVGTYDGTLLTYDLFLNTVTGKAKVIVKNGASTIKTISYETTATGINTINLQFNKNYGAFTIDNISLYSLVAPAFTLTESSKTVSVGNSETVNVTGITGSISVSSDNTAVATASYDAGVITINGVADGVATITVTGTNDELTLEKTIEVTVGAVAKTNITVNYLCGGSPIAASATIENVNIGSTLTLSDITYSETIAGVGCRYANPTFSVGFPYTVVENGVIDITYTQQNAVSSLKVYANVNSTNHQIKSYDLDSKYVGDVVTVTYPEYYLEDGILYSTTQGAHGSSDGNGYYKWTHTLTGDDIVVTYGTTVASNVVCYAEAENISGGTASSGGNADIRCSDGKGATFASATDVVTLPAGKYHIYAQLWGNAGASITFSDGTNDILTGSTAGYLLTIDNEFTITESKTITVTGGDGSKVLDLVYIVKTEEHVNVSAAGMATYVPSFDLNFSSASLKAYTAEVSGKGVCTLHQIDEVPAGTPVLLIGATENIPVMTGATAVSELNNLVAGTDAAVATTDGGYTNMILNNVGGNVGFYLAAGQTVAANRAYLHFDSTLAPDPSAPMMLVFDGEATGIADVRGKMEDVRSDFFDLQGRKVAQPAKGLYIVNGKKVVIK